MYVSRETTGDCYDDIIEDLVAAEKLLTQTDPHRVTVWAVKAFLAKAYFFTGQTENAKKYLEDCIRNSGKSLVSFENYRMMYNGYDAYEYNSESFYEVGNRADPTGGAAYGQPNTGSTLSMYYCPFCINPQGQRVAMSYGNQYLHDRNLARFGYTDPAPLSDDVLWYEKPVAEGEDAVYHLDAAYLEKLIRLPDIYLMYADPQDHLANDPLLYERWAELFGEMRWWEDVRRLRIGKQEADFYKTVSGPGTGKTNIVWKDRNYAMPIPLSEFESNPSEGMVQTPGY